MDMTPVWLTLRMAALSTLLLMLIGTPLAWWLAHTRSRAGPVFEAVTALPLVLPPTVLGFYLLILFNPQAPLGRFWLTTTGDTLAFSFSGMVIASAVYSLPFVVQPLQSAFMSQGRWALEAAATLGASRLDAFFSVATPMASRGFLSAAVLGFAHTVGEFGVVLMVGGNIPGRTQVVSIAIYEQVETLNYADAHRLSAGLLLFSFVTLLLVYSFNRRAIPRLG